MSSPQARGTFVRTVLWLECFEFPFPNIPVVGSVTTGLLQSGFCFESGENYPMADGWSVDYTILMRLLPIIMTSSN